MKKLVTFDRAQQATRQHKTPCSDCPFSRTALPGWLGGQTPEEYRLLAHSDAFVECHAVQIAGKHAECAGVAIYRANVVKRPPPGAMELPADREHVFGTPVEFLEYHSGGGWKDFKAKQANKNLQPKAGAGVEKVRRGVFGSVVGTALAVCKPDGRVIAIFGERETRKANVYLGHASDLFKAYAPGDIKLGEHVPLSCRLCGKPPRVMKWQNGAGESGFRILSGCGAITAMAGKREEATLAWNAAQARRGAVL